MWIQLNNHPKLELDAIYNSDPPFELSAYEKEVVVFIRAWNKGQEVFPISTSGTTGNPTRTNFRREQLERSAELTAERFELRAGQTLLLCLGMNYVAGIMMLVRGLHLKMNVLVAEPGTDSLQTLQIQQDQSIEFAAFVPMQIEALLSHSQSRNNLKRIKKVLIGGASVSSELHAKLEELNPLDSIFFHSYSMTETLTHVAIKTLNGAAKSRYYVALAGVELEMDERNCLIARSPVNDMQSVITNDIIEFKDEDRTRFEWKGRWDNVINSGGHKVHAETVEAELLKLNNSGNAFFVSGIPNPIYGEKVVLFAERSFGLVVGDNMLEKAFPSEFSDTLKSVVHSYAIPKSIVIIENFSRTESGKIQRKKTVNNWLKDVK